ncbi:CHAD domain-containing protein [Coralliovum pocilloporae]|uniref:CHAD domain-containing protein n=1 Tax=Coralliovum pocilloporae TaxID=3066369 RepID=UPI003306D562
MARRLKVGRGIGQELKRIVRSGLKKTISDLASAADDPDARILSARKRIKIIRANLVLAKSQLGPHYRTETDNLRSVAHRLAKARDLQALIVIAENLARTSRAQDADTAIALCTLSVSLSHLLTEERPGKTELTEAIGTLTGCLERVTHWSLTDDCTPYFDAYQKTYSGVRKRLDFGFRENDPIHIHDGRKLVIRHRHHLVALSQAAPDHFISRAEDIRTLRRSLGDYDDLMALVAFVGKEGPALYDLSPRQRDLIANRAREIAQPFAQAAKAHFETMFAEKPKRHRFNAQSLWNLAEAETGPAVSD